MGLGRGHLAAALAAVLVVGGSWAFIRAEDRRLAASQAVAVVEPIDAVPQGALLLVSASVGRLRAAGVASELLDAGRDVPGLGDVRQACGFDPVAIFDEIALAIPDAGADGDFGVVARLGGVGDTRVRPEQILACTSKVITSRGGTPAVSRLGRFETVRDVSLATPGGEIATRPDGSLVLLGAGAYLRAMVDAAEGTIPSARGHVGHGRLRAALDPTAAVRATIVLGAQQRAAIADEVARSAAGGAPPAVAKVGSAGLALGFDGDRTTLQVVLGCDDPRAALEVAAAVEAFRGDPVNAPLLRVAGLGGVVDGLAIEVERDLVHARVTMPRAEAEALAARLLGAR